MALTDLKGYFRLGSGDWGEGGRGMEDGRRVGECGIVGRERGGGVGDGRESGIWEGGRTGIGGCE